MADRKKILVVEDNPVNMRLVERTLQQIDHDLIKGVNGEEALALAAEHKPDVIVLDIQIPKIDGYEVIRRLKADPELKSIPVIALTAHAMKGDEKKIMDSGCDAYVSKPLQLGPFRDLVKSFLG